MARAKLICKGINADGSPCKNWALRNSYYCGKHQNQITEDDIKQSQMSQGTAAIFIFIIAIIVIVISMVAGCEKEALKWLSG